VVERWSLDEKGVLGTWYIFNTDWSRPRNDSRKFNLILSPRDLIVQMNFARARISSVWRTRHDSVLSSGGGVSVPRSNELPNVSVRYNRMERQHCVYRDLMIRTKVSAVAAFHLLAVIVCHGKRMLS
jgi:hypothetical protein